eukprot:3308936-Rhodomonas_salina.3
MPSRFRDMLAHSHAQAHVKLTRTRSENLTPLSLSLSLSLCAAPEHAAGVSGFGVGGARPSHEDGARSDAVGVERLWWDHTSLLLRFLDLLPVRPDPRCMSELDGQNATARDGDRTRRWQKPTEACRKRAMRRHTPTEDR